MAGAGMSSGWWERNWKWVVPVGFLSVVLLLSLAVICLYFLIFGQVRSSEVYVEAMSAARSDAEVCEAIGKPTEDGLFPSFSFYSSGASGYAEFSIPISGPDGSATMYGAAEKSLGDWTFKALIVEVDESGRRIILHDEGKDMEAGDQVRT
jgi:hypothetical protein